MNNIYQPIVVEKSNEIIKLLDESGFFDDCNIKNTDFAFDYFCLKLTDKFIDGKLEEDGEIFTEDEMNIFLNEIFVGTILNDMKKEGIVDVIEDENNEERFFLTEKGKNIAAELKKIT